MPRRYKLVDDEPWHSRGVRRMNAKNFAVFYYVLEDYNEVYIQNVIYEKRDIPKVLRDLYGERALHESLTSSQLTRLFFFRILHACTDLISDLVEYTVKIVQQITDLMGTDESPGAGIHILYQPDQRIVPCIRSQQPERNSVAVCVHMRCCHPVGIGITPDS